MLNNEFRLIGTVVSEYERFGSDNFPKYNLTIEVERKKKGAPSLYRLTIYEKNYTVDITKSVKGKQVIVTGYLDEYKGNYSLIMQDMIVVGEVVGVGAAAETKKVVDTPIDNIEVELPDDDLPF